MISIVRTGGKQYIVKPKQLLKTEKVETAVGVAHAIEVLLNAADELTETPTVAIGTPVLEAPMKAMVQEHGRGKKISIVKYKRKVRYRRRTGHRQDNTKMVIPA